MSARSLYRWISTCLMCVLIGALSGVFSGCASVETIPRKESADKPEPETETLDYSKLFEQSRYSHSALNAPIPSGSMDRVLLSPNLVFETSRSSHNEPPTQGPDGSDDDTPRLDDALGKPIDRNLSSRLLEYLVQQGSDPIAPVITGVVAIRV